MNNKDNRENHIENHIQRKKGKHRVFSDFIEILAEVLEIVVAVIVLCGFVISVIPLLQDMPGLLSNDNSYTFHVFLEHAFNLVIGIEFIRMLIRHTPGSALEVLLFAIARHMVLDGSSGLELLLGVASIAGIFAIRKYLYVHSFQSEDDEDKVRLIHRGDHAASRADHTGSCADQIRGGGENAGGEDIADDRKAAENAGVRDSREQ